MRQKVMWWTVDLGPLFETVAAFLMFLEILTPAECIAAALGGATACEALPGSFANPGADICAVGMASFGAYCVEVIQTLRLLTLDSILMTYACSQILSLLLMMVGVEHQMILVTLLIRPVSWRIPRQLQ
mmetsp:Transcript_19817/g.32563  ORF Transcript_19817/g.32563 Transcript_19817/m.32563 type:complete len:129 (-) Transcript_19817:198-584(-)